MPKATINRFTASTNDWNPLRMCEKVKSLIFSRWITHKCSKILSFSTLISQRFWYVVQHFSYRKKRKIFTFVKSQLAIPTIILWMFQVKYKFIVVYRDVIILLHCFCFLWNYNWILNLSVFISHKIKLYHEHCLSHSQ